LPSTKLAGCQRTNLSFRRRFSPGEPAFSRDFERQHAWVAASGAEDFPVTIRLVPNGVTSYAEWVSEKNFGPAPNRGRNLYIYVRALGS